MEIVKANGGAAVHMIPPQSYINLDKGTVDNAFLTYAQVKDYKLTEVCDYFYDGSFGCGTYLITMNWDAWNEMAPSDQKLFEDTWLDALVVCHEGMLDSMEEGRETIAEAGLSITEPTKAELAAWITDSKPAVDYWVESSVNAGIADPLPYLEKWEAIRNKYLAMH
jgi:TRAP-type C4-dicarboxylate transport system substrate-binding protein